jgi:hypothetical protein
MHGRLGWPVYPPIACDCNLSLEWLRAAIRHASSRVATHEHTPLSAGLLCTRGAGCNGVVHLQRPQQQGGHLWNCGAGSPRGAAAGGPAVAATATGSWLFGSDGSRAEGKAHPTASEARGACGGAPYVQQVAQVGVLHPHQEGKWGCPLGCQRDACKVLLLCGANGQLRRIYVILLLSATPPGVVAVGPEYSILSGQLRAPMPVPHVLCGLALFGHSPWHSVGNPGV